MGGSSDFPYSAGFTTTTDVQHEQADEPSSHDSPMLLITDSWNS
jgi:hypothetical protein